MREAFSFDLRGRGLRAVPAANDAWIAALFGAAPGAWYDPSDRSTLFQDAAMLTPVTSDGDPVGAMRDKSGAGYHLTQSSAASRPIYRSVGSARWLDFDGVDDLLSAAAPLASSGTSYFLGAAFSLASALPACGVFGDAVQSNGGALVGVYQSRYFAYSNPGGTPQATRAISDISVDLPVVTSLYTGAEPFAYDSILAEPTNLWDGANNYVQSIGAIRLGKVITGATTSTYFAGKFYGGVYASASRGEAEDLNSWLLARAQP